MIKEITKYLNYVKNSIRSSLPEKSTITSKYLSQIKKFAQENLGNSSKFVSPKELINAFKFNDKFIASEDFVSGCLFVLYVTYWLKDIYNYSTNDGQNTKTILFETDIRPKILEILKSTVSYKDGDKKRGLIDIVHYVTKNPSKATSDIINLLKYKDKELPSDELNKKYFTDLFNFLDDCENKYIGVTNSMKTIYDRIDKKIAKLEENSSSKSKNSTDKK